MYNIEKPIIYFIIPLHSNNAHNLKYHLYTAFLEKNESFHIHRCANCLWNLTDMSK